MFVGESIEAASTAIRATSRSKAWLVRYGCFCRGTLSGCLAIKDISAKSCTMNTYTKWWGGGIKFRSRCTPTIACWGGSPVRDDRN